jgi:signal transduction histidine kinase
LFSALFLLSLLFLLLFSSFFFLLPSSFFFFLSSFFFLSFAAEQKSFIILSIVNMIVWIQILISFHILGEMNKNSVCFKTFIDDQIS